MLSDFISMLYLKVSSPIRNTMLMGRHKANNITLDVLFGTESVKAL